SSAPLRSPSLPPGGRCRLNAIAVPSCGVLWGASTQGQQDGKLTSDAPPMREVRELEQNVVGRPLDFVYRYHDYDDQIPDDAELQTVAEGKLLHIAIAARDYTSRAPGLRWADYAAGRYDQQLTAQARGVASLKVPVFMTWEQEASQNKKVGIRGTAQDFVRAWRHIHEVFDRAGATNAVWTWVMTGGEDRLGNVEKLWPGNDVVDWISWNVYNQSGCRSGRIDPAEFVSFRDKVAVFYDFVKERGRSMGMDTSKPMMISETGSAQYPGDPQKTADWYAQIPDALKDYPQIKAVTLWDSVDRTAKACSYELDAAPQIAQAVAQASRDPYLDIGGALRPQESAG
ncbi:MAG: hypothetical protein ACRC35_13330, partial [Angustibacter sp.]